VCDDPSFSHHHHRLSFPCIYTKKLSVSFALEYIKILISSTYTRSFGSVSVKTRSIKLPPAIIKGLKLTLFIILMGIIKSGLFSRFSSSANIINVALSFSKKKKEDLLEIKIILLPDY